MDYNIWIIPYLKYPLKKRFNMIHTIDKLNFNRIQFQLPSVIHINGEYNISRNIKNELILTTIWSNYKHTIFKAVSINNLEYNSLYL